MNKFRYTIFILSFSLSALAQMPDNIQTKNNLVYSIVSETDAIDATLPQINILIKKGEKAQARKLIQETLKLLEGIEANYKRLAQLDETIIEDIPSLSQLQETKLYLNNKLNQLRYTCVYLQCNAELFGNEYTTLRDLVLTALSDENVSYVDSAGIMDWTVTISAQAREYNKAEISGRSIYFAYVDVKTVMENASNGKRVLDKTITEKGGSPFGFEKAAQEAYKTIAPKVSAIIKEQIAQ